MIISKDYGPQLDPTDGTIGKLQLVKRWVLVSGEHDEIWTHRQGRYTHATRKGAQLAVDEYVLGNPLDRVPADLRTIQMWCYPGHFDPCGRIEP